MASRTELGEFLRIRRSRVLPHEVGLPASTRRRRTAGLRREEVAILAGVSVEYYRRLEQGKQSSPSPSVLDAIARVLRLGDDEHRHLVELGRGQSVGAQAPVAISRVVREDVLRMLDIVHPYPACVVSRASDLLAANTPALRLFPGIEDWPREERNTARYAFLHPMARQLYSDWDDVARGVVAHLRGAITTHPDASDIEALIDELLENSVEFARLWREYDVRARTNGTKLYRHPSSGEMELSYEAYDIARSGGQRLIVYQAAPGTVDHGALLSLSGEQRTAQLGNAVRTRHHAPSATASVVR